MGVVKYGGFDVLSVINAFSGNMFMASARYFPYLSHADCNSEGLRPCNYRQDFHLYDFHYTLKPISSQLRAEAVCNELIRRCS